MLEFQEFKEIIKDQVAIRTINKLYPAGGQHSKIFPSTYAGGVYAIEDRLVNEKTTKCVLMDSVASQANRMEEALQNAVDSEKIKLPLAVIDFSESSKDDLDIVGNRLTSLQAPHRIADALFRECILNGKPFRESEEGIKILNSTPYSSTSLFGTCPTALLFGMWDSAGPKGGSGNKFERVITSEIVGINAVFGVGTSSRIDPLIQKTSDSRVWEKEDGGWTLDENEAKKDEKDKSTKYREGKLSNINLGNVAPSLNTYSDNLPGSSNPLSNDNTIKKGDIAANGATIEYAEQTCVISLAGLRKLHFPNENEKSINIQKDDAARAVLTALGLVAFTLSVENGLDLRSRCVLIQKEPTTWDVLGNMDKTFTLDSKGAIKLLEDSIKDATSNDLPWDTTPMKLLPNQDLIQCIKNSQSGLEDDSKGD